MTKPWKTIAIGTYKTKGSLIKAVEKEHKISDWAKELIDNKYFKLSKKQDIDLYQMTIKELTGKELATTDDIYRAMKEKGYSTVPDDTVFYLRMAYADQPQGEWITCTSKPLAAADGVLSVFSVGRGSGGSWVFGLYASPGYHWHSNDRLAFCRNGSLPLESFALSEPGELPKELIINGFKYRREND